MGALRHNGMTAPFVVDGPMTGPTFLCYVKQCLAPTLMRNDTIVMDNLPTHKVAGVREAIEARGARLRYLPQYSPDLNPIEMAFSKLKAFLRKFAERTVRRLCCRIGSFAPPQRPRGLQLFQTCRLCVKSNGICSSLPARARANDG